MTHKEQIEFRLYLLDHIIKIYQGMSHQNGTPKSEIADVLATLNTWRDETMLLQKAYENE